MAGRISWDNLLSLGVMSLHMDTHILGGCLRVCIGVGIICGITVFTGCYVSPYKPPHLFLFWQSVGIGIICWVMVDTGVLCLSLHLDILLVSVCVLDEIVPIESLLIFNLRIFRSYRATIHGRMAAMSSV